MVHDPKPQMQGKEHKWIAVVWVRENIVHWRKRIKHTMYNFLRV